MKVFGYMKWNFDDIFKKKTVIYKFMNIRHMETEV